MLREAFSLPRSQSPLLDRPLIIELFRGHLAVLKRRQDISHDRRQRLLHRSRGKLVSSEVYTVGDVPPASAKQYLDQSSHWIPDRQILHEEITARAVTAAQELAFQTAEANAVYVLRGNTAAGKSTIVKKLGIFPHPSQTNKEGIINPDAYKVPLLAAESSSGVSLATHAQIHEESSVLARRVLREVESLPGGSLVIDKRFYGADDIDEALRLAERTGKQLHLVDIEAPLEISLLRILTRERGGEDPRVPFEAVVEAFAGIRRHRERLVRLAETDARIASYCLYVVNQRGDSEQTAQLEFTQQGRGVRCSSPVAEERFFQSLLQDTEEEITKLTKQQITEEYIRHIVPEFQERQRDRIRYALTPHLGRTLREAVDVQAAELPSFS